MAYITHDKLEISVDDIGKYHQSSNGEDWISAGSLATFGSLAWEEYLKIANEHWEFVKKALGKKGSVSL